MSIDKFLAWIRKLWLPMAVIILFVPAIVIHLLFKVSLGADFFAAEWSAGDLLGYVSGFEAFVGTVALGALALWQNQTIHRQHIESLEPILSMKLIQFDGMLYLVIQNTGLTPAKEIHISVERITNNGSNPNLTLDALFGSTFELYPNEVVQGRVAFSAADISTSIFPQLFVKVAYLHPDINRRFAYDRSIIFDNGYTQKIVADVNMDFHTMESDIDCIARASVRMANYFDGHQLAKFDKLDLLAGRSLQNDIATTMHSKRKAPIINRRATIQKRLRPRRTSESSQ